MPRKSARLRIQEIKQPSTAETPISVWTQIIQTLIQGLYYSFSLFSLCHFVSLLKYKLAGTPFSMLQCSGERRQAAVAAELWQQSPGIPLPQRVPSRTVRAAASDLSDKKGDTLSFTLPPVGAEGPVHSLGSL